MALMRSPEGVEQEVVPAGVAALGTLGWVLVESEKSEPARKVAERRPAKK